MPYANPKPDDAVPTARLPESGEGPRLGSPKLEPELKALLAARPPEARHLLALLQAIQHHYRYLPEEALRAVAAYLNLPLARVFNVATYYSALSLKPKGTTIIKVCCGTACHLRGAPALLGALEKELGVETGQTTANGLYTLEAANCLGACTLAPLVLFNDTSHRGQTPALVKKLVRSSPARP